MFWLLLTTLSWAHKPSFGDAFIDPETAFVIENPDISIVVYQQLTCENRELWMQFEVEAGQELYLQVGVPVIDRLTDYRPKLAVVGEGFETSDEVPFDLPEGMNAKVFGADMEPTDFYEPFTQTESWIYIEETLTIPVSGIGYVVAWNPDNVTGKLWVSTGTVEDFSDASIDDFIYWGEAANNFHETGKYEIPPTTIEQDCEQQVEANTDGNEKTSGCSYVGFSDSWVMLLCGLILVRRNDF